MAETCYVERAQFILGDSGAGKSTQLRSLFRDRRFHRDGEIPEQRNLPKTHYISNERRLYLRLTSPHEYGESLNEFLDKFENKMRYEGVENNRWNFFGPLQTESADTNQIKDGKVVIKEFMDRFKPERVRAVILSPNCSGGFMKRKTLLSHLEELHEIDCEVILTDARVREKNGLIYSDFFDFT